MRSRARARIASGAPRAAGSRVRAQGRRPNPPTTNVARMNLRAVKIKAVEAGWRTRGASHAQSRSLGVPAESQSGSDSVSRPTAAPRPAARGTVTHSHSPALQAANAVAAQWLAAPDLTSSVVACALLHSAIHGVAWLALESRVVRKSQEVSPRLVFVTAVARPSHERCRGPKPRGRRRGRTALREAREPLR